MIDPYDRDVPATPSELHAAMPPSITVDLFDDDTGLVSDHCVTITRTPDQVMLTTSTGLVGALIALDPGNHWHTVNLSAAGFTATVHAADLVFDEAPIDERSAGCQTTPAPPISSARCAS